MASTKEQIQKAALVAFRREEVSIGNAKATLVEMSQSQRKELNARLYVCDDATGDPTTFNADGEADPKGEQWHFRDGVKFVEEWISATINPSFTVEEIAEWPESLKKRLFDDARRINGIEPAETIAKNS